MKITSSPQEFPSTLDALVQINATSISVHNQKLLSLLDAAKLRESKKDKETTKDDEALVEKLTTTGDQEQPPQSLAGPAIPDRLREQMVGVFQEWVSLVADPSSMVYLYVTTCSS